MGILQLLGAVVLLRHNGRLVGYKLTEIVDIEINGNNRDWTERMIEFLNGRGQFDATRMRGDWTVRIRAGKIEWVEVEKYRGDFDEPKRLGGGV